MRARRILIAIGIGSMLLLSMPPAQAKWQKQTVHLPPSGVPDEPPESAQSGLQTSLIEPAHDTMAVRHLEWMSPSSQSPRLSGSKIFHTGVVTRQYFDARPETTRNA